MSHKLIDYINATYDIGEVYHECTGRFIPQGKFMCPNPEHQHHNNTPSAKRYGNIIKCFGQCGCSFGSYQLMKWYKPEWINKIKETEIVTEVQKQKPVQIEKIEIDRNKSMAEILKIITGICP